MQLIQKETRNIMKEVAAKMGLPVEVVISIYMSEFKYVAEEIRSGEKNKPDTFKNILLKYLGTFHVSSRKLHYMMKNTASDEKHT